MCERPAFSVPRIRSTKIDGRSCCGRNAAAPVGPIRCNTRNGTMIGNLKPRLILATVALLPLSAAAQPAKPGSLAVDFQSDPAKAGWELLQFSWVQTPADGGWVPGGSRTRESSDSEFSRIRLRERRERLLAGPTVLRDAASVLSLDVSVARASSRLLGGDVLCGRRPDAAGRSQLGHLPDGRLDRQRTVLSG